MKMINKIKKKNLIMILKTLTMIKIQIFKFIKKKINKQNKLIKTI